MAATMANMSSTTVGAVRADGLGALPSIQSLKVSRVAGLGAPMRRGIRVRCEAGKDPVSDVREAVDRGTKTVISKDAVLKHQETDASEKKSVMGTEPTSGAPWPRPEVERRPETGSKSFGSVFAFDGAAPETINGRLAMVGIVWAVIGEQITGKTVVEQLFGAGQTGLLYFLVAAQVITFASLVPIMSGESTDARRNGPFTARAERWNGRMAMVGFFSLVVTEMFTHFPIFG